MIKRVGSDAKHGGEDDSSDRPTYSRNRSSCCLRAIAQQQAGGTEPRPLGRSDRATPGDGMAQSISQATAQNTHTQRHQRAATRNVTHAQSMADVSRWG